MAQQSAEAVRSRRPGRVLERTLADLSAAMEGSLTAERIAGRQGLLQSFDPRVKLLSTVGLLLAVSLSHSQWVIVALYLLAVVLAWRSAVPVGFFVRRVWLFMPFFTGLVALPALFLVPGPALVRLPLGLTVTETGLTSAVFLLLRVGTSVSLALLLVLTTPWNSVLKALAVLRVPDVFIVILGMTYRYIYLFLRTANDMFLSRQSRIAGPLTGAQERRLMAASAGVLLSRSLELSSEVYLAMASRGLRGYPRTIDTFEMHARDWLFGAGTLAVVVVAIWFGR